MIVAKISIQQFFIIVSVLDSDWHLATEVNVPLAGMLIRTELESERSDTQTKERISRGEDRK